MGDDLLVPFAVQQHQRVESAVGEEPCPQSVIDLRDVAQRPQGPASRIDAMPCCPRVSTEGDEVANDRRTALPVVQQDRTQATPDMSIKSAQHKLLAGRDDPEVLMPPA